jgi:hypothetical protein
VSIKSQHYNNATENGEKIHKNKLIEHHVVNSRDKTALNNDVSASDWKGTLNKTQNHYLMFTLADRQAKAALESSLLQ